MRLTIAPRIFLALTLVSLVILTLNAAITRWNLQRGFFTYVAEQESRTVAAAVAELAEMYEAEGGWDSFKGNPRRWNTLLRDNSERPAPKRQPGLSRPPPQGKEPPPPGARPHDPLGLGWRISLVDADRNLIVGRGLDIGSSRSVPVVVDNVTAGYVLIAPDRQLANPIDRNFLAEQERSIYLIAIAALIFAAAISAVLARQLTRPIRSLASGARSITAGQYDTRIPAARNDELGDLARDFNQLSETLEANRAARRQWVADIAHELRTPLAILRGELDAIEDGVRPYGAKTQTSLQAETSRLSKLVDELHDLSVYDEGDPHIRRDRLDVAALLGDVLESAKNRLRKAGIESSSEFSNEKIIMLGDETRLERLFTNLVENTLRYTDAPGKLIVKCAKKDGYVVIEFADSSPGVPDDAMGKLFDRLFRVDGSRDRNTGGSGLGLSICKAIVESHGGTIDAVSSQMGGLLIRVLLPTIDPTESV